MTTLHCTKAHCEATLKLTMRSDINNKMKIPLTQKSSGIGIKVTQLNGSVLHHNRVLTMYIHHNRVLTMYIGIYNAVYNIYIG